MSDYATCVHNRMYMFGLVSFDNGISDIENYSNAQDILVEHQSYHLTQLERKKRVHTFPNIIAHLEFELNYFETVV